MNIPLFISERRGPQITTRPLSVGCFIFSQMDRQVATHWAARPLMSHYDAIVADARVVVDGNIISAAGVTAGLDAALVLYLF